MHVQFINALNEQKKQNKHLGWAKLDFDILEHRSRATALLAIRLQLAKQCGISFPAFDMAFARYFSFTHPELNIKDSYPNLFKNPNDILLDLAGVASTVSEAIPFGRVIYKFGHKLTDFTQTWLKRRGKAIVNEIEQLDQHKLDVQLPKYLGADIYDWLFNSKAEQAGKNHRIVILIDTYEALWQDQTIKTGLGSIHVDFWVRKLAEETPGVLYIIQGREKLTWANIEQEWQDDIESHLLGGLSPEDADNFLQQVPVVEEIRQGIVNSAAGIPFYLDVQVKTYEIFKQQQTSPTLKHFSVTKTEILERFVSHLNENTLRALQIASHARYVNEQLILQLVETIPSIKTELNFKQLISFSFWKQEGSDWYLHALMRDYLQDNLRHAEPEFFHKIHQGLFDIYDSNLEEIEQVTGITESHKQCLMEAGHHLQQYDHTKFPDWVDKRTELFFKAYLWELVEPLYQRSLIIREEVLGKDNLDMATSLNNLAASYKSQGKYPEAEPLYQRALSILDTSFPNGYPNLDVIQANYQDLKSKMN